AELEKVKASVDGPRGRLRGADAGKIGERAGKISNKYKVAKHFTLLIADGAFAYERKAEQINSEASLDGLYAICTTLPAVTLGAPAAVRAYKERKMAAAAFGTMTVTTAIPPLHPPRGGAGGAARGPRLQAAQDGRARVRNDEGHDRDPPDPPPPRDPRPRARVPLHPRLLRRLRAPRAPPRTAVHRRNPARPSRPRQARHPLSIRPRQSRQRHHRPRPPRPHPHRPTRRPRHPLPQHRPHRPRRAHLHPPNDTHPATNPCPPTTRHQAPRVAKAKPARNNRIRTTTRDSTSQPRKLPARHSVGMPTIYGSATGLSAPTELAR